MVDVGLAYVAADVIRYLLLHNTEQAREILDELTERDLRALRGACEALGALVAEIVPGKDEE